MPVQHAKKAYFMMRFLKFPKHQGFEIAWRALALLA